MPATATPKSLAEVAADEWRSVIVAMVDGENVPIERQRTAAAGLAKSLAELETTARQVAALRDEIASFNPEESQRRLNDALAESRAASKTATQAREALETARTAARAASEAETAAAEKAGRVQSEERDACRHASEGALRKRMLPAGENDWRNFIVA